MSYDDDRDVADEIHEVLARGDECECASISPAAILALRTTHLRPVKRAQNWCQADQEGEDGAALPPPDPPAMPRRFKCICQYDDCRAVIREGDLIDGMASHGICDACMAKHFPGITRRKKGA
jgi:hypothetical protein